MSNDQAIHRTPSHMRIHIEDEDDPRLVVCRVTGSIIRDALAKDDAPEDKLGSEAFAKSILLDLSASTEIDSVGVSWLIRFHRKCEKVKGRLAIHSAPPAIRRSFDLLNMQAIFLLADDEASARELAKLNSA